MRDAMFIDNTQKTLNKKMDGHFPDLLRLFNNEQRSDSFAAHLKHHYNSTTSRRYLRKYVAFKVLKKLNPIDAMKKITKSNCK